MKTIYVPCFLEGELPLAKIKNSLLKQIPYLRIGLFATIQHLPKLAQVKKFLEANDRQVILGGQILGCDFAKVRQLTAEVDAFLYLGSGKFHPLMIAGSSHKPVLVFNPYSLSLQKISKKEIKKFAGKRKGALAKFLEASSLGILISLKTGQSHPEQAKKIKEKLEKSGKKAFLLAGNEISPERVLGFNVDAWVNTACPRIVEDYFAKPVLNPEELGLIL